MYCMHSVQGQLSLIPVLARWRYVFVMAGLLVTALLLLTFYEPYYFYYSTPADFKQWYPRFHTGLYAITHSFLFTHSFLLTVWFVCWAGFFVPYVPAFMKGVKHNAALLLVSAGVALVVAEWALRTMGIHAGYSEASGDGDFLSPFDADSIGWVYTWPPDSLITEYKKEFTTQFKTNADGLKNKPIDTSANTWRMVVLGDSFTEGVGAPNDSCYPRLLENILNHNTTPAWDVINAGVSGADVFTEYQLLKQRLLKYKPALVLVTINSSDYFEVKIRGGSERFLPDNQVRYKQAPWYISAYRNSYLVRLLVHNAFGYDYAFQKKSMQAINDSLAGLSINQGIDSLAALARTHNLPLLFVFQPNPTELFTDPDNVNTLSVKHCSQKGYLYALLKPCMVQAPVTPQNLTDYYWPLDGHYKAAGYNILAQCVYQALMQNGLLPTSGRAAGTLPKTNALCVNAPY